MVPRRFRLRDKRQYESLFKRGSRARGTTFSVVYQQAQPGSIGFVITKKVSKQATERNRTKRRLRAAWQLVLQEPAHAPLLRSYRLAVVIHRLNTEISFADLVSDVRKVVSKINPLG